MSVYLDCNATTPIEPRVRDKILHYLDSEFGNAASRTHIWGTKAKQAVQKAREQVAQVVDAKADEVVFTSGATESNNLAILGLANHMENVGKKHILSTKIEHKAVLEPLAMLQRKGFEVTLLSPNRGGRIEINAFREALRADTALVSIMQVNNETGVSQPVEEIAGLLEGHDAFLHVDAAQGYGKEISPLLNKRVDMISISAHKIYGPKGIGALVARRRGFKRLPIEPIMFGGGHEGGLRPGTLPVHLIVGLGESSAIALKEHGERKQKCLEFRDKVIAAFSQFRHIINGDPSYTLPHVANISIEGLNSEAAIVALKDVIGVSNGSACTSHSYEPSHVLMAMGLSDDIIKGSLRLSWCHMTEEPNWDNVVSALKRLL